MHHHADDCDHTAALVRTAQPRELPLVWQRAGQLPGHDGDDGRALLAATYAAGQEPCSARAAPARARGRQPASTWIGTPSNGKSDPRIVVLTGNCTVTGTAVDIQATAATPQQVTVLEGAAWATNALNPSAVIANKAGLSIMPVPLLAGACAALGGTVSFSYVSAGQETAATAPPTLGDARRQSRHTTPARDPGPSVQVGNEMGPRGRPGAGALDAGALVHIQGDHGSQAVWVCADLRQPCPPSASTAGRSRGPLAT